MTPEDATSPLLVALERLTVAVQTLTAVLAPSTDSEPTCFHPQEMRVDLSMMGKLGRFQCSPQLGGCGYKNF